jgi:predicted transcriptional regulator
MDRFYVYEHRRRLIEAIAQNPNATIVELARLSGCERGMVGKYKRRIAADKE